MKAQFQRELEAAKARNQRELDVAKAQHQRDLESYKVRLIAETERTKATQDLAKSSALKVLEKKFLTFDSLHRAMAGISSDLLSTSQTATQAPGAPERLMAANKRMVEAGAARVEAALLLPDQRDRPLLGMRRST